MDLECELTIAESVPRGQPAELTFTLTNRGSGSVKVLTWHTPFEGMKAAMFTVTRDNNVVDYHGRMFKRGAPRAEDYLQLEAGERKQTTIDLGEGWDVSQPGVYSIEYSSQLFDVVSGATTTPRSPDHFASMMPSCNAVSFSRSP